MSFSILTITPKHSPDGTFISVLTDDRKAEQAARDFICEQVSSGLMEAPPQGIAPTQDMIDAHAVQAEEFATMLPVAQQAINDLTRRYQHRLMINRSRNLVRDSIDAILNNREPVMSAIEILKDDWFNYSVDVKETQTGDFYVGF